MLITTLLSSRMLVICVRAGRMTASARKTRPTCTSTARRRVVTLSVGSSVFWGNVTIFLSPIHYVCMHVFPRPLGWSPVTRKILDIEFIPIEPIYLLPHECLDYNDAFLAALVLQNRLKHMFDASVFNGISTNAPNEFLMNYGLAEAVLYSMRLYDVVVKSLDDVALNTKSEEAMAFVLSSLSYDGDAIGRVLPQFYFSLESVRMGIIHKIGDLQQQQQQLLQKYHGLKDTYLRENFANVKPNACSVFFDQNWSSIVDMYGTQLHFTDSSVVPKFEYLRTLDTFDEMDGPSEGEEMGDVFGSRQREPGFIGEMGNNGAALDAGASAGSDVFADAGSTGARAIGVDAISTKSGTASATPASDNCFNSDGSRLEPHLCYLLNYEKSVRDGDEKELAARTSVQTTSKYAVKLGIIYDLAYLILSCLN